MSNSNEAGNSLPMIGSFSLNETSLTVYGTNDNPLFNAKEVCDYLGLGNVGQAMTHLENDEKLTSLLMMSGQRRQMWFVNESGLYHLIFQSRKPEARRFRKWVTGEVLPQIRRTGSYSAPVRKNLLPRERSLELGDFHRELRQWVTHEDERTVASLMNVTRNHVHKVLTGERPSYGVLCMLVDCAKDNRKAGRRRVEITPARRKAQVEQLRLEFMKGKEAEDGTL